MRALTVGLLLSTALLCAAPPARAQNLHYGMNTLVLTPPMADKVVELGAGIVRVAYGWDVIEGRCKGCAASGRAMDLISWMDWSVVSRSLSDCH